MAAPSLSQASLVRQKPSSSFTSLQFQTPRLFSPHHLSTRSSRAFLVNRRNGFVPKASLTAVTNQSSSNSNSPVPSKKPTNSIIVIDNYDSFTYNLCQLKYLLILQRLFAFSFRGNGSLHYEKSLYIFWKYVGEIGCHFEVYRNDEITVEDLKRMNPRGILISPGPGTPQDSGISMQTVLELGPTVPLFGVCMGLQCIGEAFGGKVVRAPSGVMHGKSSLVYYDEKGEESLFIGLSNPFTAGRYHSLVIEKESFPGDELEITAWTEDGLVMAARHKKYKHLQGVQFHPESIISTEGKVIVSNFVKLIERKEAESQN